MGVQFHGMVKTECNKRHGSSVACIWPGFYVKGWNILRAELNLSFCFSLLETETNELVLNDHGSKKKIVDYEIQQCLPFHLTNTSEKDLARQNPSLFYQLKRLSGTLLFSQQITHLETQIYSVCNSKKKVFAALVHLLLCDQTMLWKKKMVESRWCRITSLNMGCCFPQSSPWHLIVYAKRHL